MLTHNDWVLTMATSPEIRIEPLAYHPELVEQAGLLLWKEWAYGDPDPGSFVTAAARGSRVGSDLPMTLVAIDGAGNAVGVVGLDTLDDEVSQAERAGRTPWIVGMVVRGDSRMLGIGRQLLECLQEVAASLGHHRTWVATGDEAVGFYQRCGWSAVEHLRLESTGVPTTILTKRTAGQVPAGIPGDHLTMPPVAISEGETLRLHSSDQLWEVSWHPVPEPPAGKRHGSSGVCVTPSGQLVLIGVDGVTWGLPGGRPETGESWEDTLRREVREEACARVNDVRLLGYVRSLCIAGHENGLVLVRAFWRAQVELDPFQPRFETAYRRLLTSTALREPRLVPGLFDPVNRRALIEAGVL